MVSFKNNNVASELVIVHRDSSIIHSQGSPGSFGNPQKNSASRDDSQAARTDSGAKLSTARHAPIHAAMLEKPVTNPTSAMDSKKCKGSPGGTSGTSTLQVGGSRNEEPCGIRRRSGPQGLRSPAAKRPVSAPVALQGWLHKQGSEGLMLWKKRWFVLSEYCLFYYKGPEEEKLLGSILLPSYRVTVCRAEEKLNKKFAFKAEHANMRTYHFAADNRDTMYQWVNALTLATLLQDPTPSVEATLSVEIGRAEGNVERSARPSVSSISSIVNQSADDSDSGFHGFQSRDDPSHASNNNSSPNSVNTASFPNSNTSNGNNKHNHNYNNNGNDNEDSIGNNVITNQVEPLANGWIQQPSPYVSKMAMSQKHIRQQMHPHQRQAVLAPHQQYACQSHQQQQSPHVGDKCKSESTQSTQTTPKNMVYPVYANAPPKPKRLTENCNNYSTPASDSDYRKSPVSPVHRINGENSVSEYGKSGLVYGTRAGSQAHMQQPLRTDKSGLTCGYAQIQLTERRTPDTYGRSAKPSNNKTNTDYEDVYGVPQLYQRPSEPVGYNKGSSPSPIVLPAHVQHQHHLQFQQHTPQQPLFCSFGSSQRSGPVSRQAQPPPRPHSADFLEFESSRRTQQQTATLNSESSSPVGRPQRPKSSLEIVNVSDTVNEYYFYSEERYAAQMRQSAVYLHHTPQHHQGQRYQPHSRPTTPSNATLSREQDFARETHSQMDNVPESLHSSLKCAKHIEGFEQRLPSSHSLQRHTGNEGKMRRSLKECHGLPGCYATSGSDGRSARINEQQRQLQHHQQQFTRSASARLPRTRHLGSSLGQNDVDDDYITGQSSVQDNRDGERKIQQREESMKRLLEWKQRMLQSPLTKKSSASGTPNKSGIPSELSSYYKQQALMELAAQEASVGSSAVRYSRRGEGRSGGGEQGQHSHIRSKSSDGRRATSNIPRYSSYSSDDEDLADVRRKRTRRPSHAGRSPRRPSSAAAPLDLHHSSAQSSQRTPEHQDQERIDSWPSGFHPSSIPLDTPQTALEITRRIESPINRPVNDHESFKASISYAGGRQISRSENDKRFPAKGDKQEWDGKIDESNVIKEFSYQYIKPEELSLQVENTNLVKCRIQSFECNVDGGRTGKEILSMQEPLKVSSLQATEAHVSKLEMSGKASTAIRNFALGENVDETVSKETEALRSHVKQASTDSTKSVKDLLADFERKSQQVKEECGRYQEVKHRGVYSDTETLLYDTESDFDQRERERIIETLEKGSNEKRSDCTVQSVNDALQADLLSENPDELPVLTEKTVGSDGGDISMATGQLSLTDNAKLNEENWRAEPFVFQDDRVFSENPEAASFHPELEDINPEEHYLPMSPRKAILDPKNEDCADAKMMERLFGNLEHEESSYVEMTQNTGNHSLLAPKGNSKKHNAADYTTFDTAHYEFICVSNSKVEPVYMEVSQISEKQEDAVVKKKKKKKKKLRKEGENSDILPVRSDLPDILTALKSDDSSDADDESSRDLDSIDAPRHPRFSLSDTFRPASYYLGASRAIITELHDSSDSELVSPPPIPTSPPPLDDLHSSETQSTSETKKNPRHMAAAKDGSMEFARDSPKAWNKPMGQVESHRSVSRFSDATISSAFRDSRISLESASGSDSVELRNPDEEARNRRLKRRPVSDEVCEVLNSLDELESLESRFDGTSIDVDQYLEELQARDAFNVDLYAKDLSYNSIYGFNENMLVTERLQKSTGQDFSRQTNLLVRDKLDRPFDYGVKSKTNSASSLPSMRVSDLPPVHQHSQSFTGDAHYENIRNFSPLTSSPLTRFDGEEGQIDDNSQIDSPRSVTHSRDSSYSTSNPVVFHHHQTASSIGEQSFTSLANSRESMHYSLANRSLSSQDTSQHRGQTDQTGAPYYYSDLQASTSNRLDTQVTRLVGHTTRLPQLNNQRNDAPRFPNKRNDIARLVNPIARQMPRQIQVEDIDEAKQIAAELRKTTRQLLTDSKVDLVDKRNFYEADTLRRVKSTEPLADFFLSPSGIDTRNLYPHGLVDKSSKPSKEESADERTALMGQITLTSHRRSRSLEGLLDDAGLQNALEQRNGASRARLSSVSSFRNHEEQSGNGEGEGERDTDREQERPPLENSPGRFIDEDPWEQDSLWRENLRRVSLRHARSLDNLESPARQPASSSVEASIESGKGRNKITRNATYVNDSVLSVRREEHGETSSVGYAWEESQTNHFLAEGNLPPAATAATRTSIESGSTSFELDREKLRQWDLLSSACLLQEQQRTSLTDSGRGLLTVLDARAKKIGESTDRLPKTRGFNEEEPKASGSGSVIGRDPLPPRAISTCQLSERSGTQQSVGAASTLPLARTQPQPQPQPQLQPQLQPQPLPSIHQSTPQLSSHLSKAASSADVRMHPSLNGDVETLPAMRSNNRLISPVPCLRVVPQHLANLLPTTNGILERNLDNTPERDMGNSPCINSWQDHRPRDATEYPYKKSAAGLQKTGKQCVQYENGGLVRVSAGELLGRTHEELVLLLIQLRRQSSALLKAMETCHMEIEAQARLAELDTPTRLENLKKLDELKKHLMDLEKQYEKGKPLVNLVDNMVKLGSLYTRNLGNDMIVSNHGLIQENTINSNDRMEFNQRVQEQRLLAEERKDWERLSPNRGQLQAKVQQLYKLDKLLQEESGTLQSLQQDKEILEKALGGLRHKLQGSKSTPAETERYKKQQLLLERELSRVRLLLAHNSKKLEETVAENARLEQDLVVLRQKLQNSQKYSGNTGRDTSGTTAALEIELRRVQQLVGDLQRQRQELSIQVRQLTEKSHNLVQQIRPHPSTVPQVHHSKKRTQNSWLVTDLDSGITVDHGLISAGSPHEGNVSQIIPNGHLNSRHSGTVSPVSPLSSAHYNETPMHNNDSFYQNSPSPNRQCNQDIFGQSHQNHIQALSSQVREQIHQHQLKQQLLKDQIQGKASPIQVNVSPLYVNTEHVLSDTIKNGNGALASPPEYVPPPPPPPPPAALLNNEDASANGNYFNSDDKYANLPHNREKQEIKTVRIVKRESERRQRDRGEKTGNIGIPLAMNYQGTAVGSKKLMENDVGSSEEIEKMHLSNLTEEQQLIMREKNSADTFSGIDDMHFQRSMSLPRGFGGQRQSFGMQQGQPVQPPPRSDSVHALKNIMARRHRARFEQQQQQQQQHEEEFGGCGGSDSALSAYTGGCDSPSSSSHQPISSSNYSTSPSFYGPSSRNDFSQMTSSNLSMQSYPFSGLRGQFSGSVSSVKSESLADISSSGPVSPISSNSGPPRKPCFGSVASIASLFESPPQLSPLFKSEAAKQIIKEVTERKVDGPRKRQIPKKKRRHYTVSSSKPLLNLEDSFSKMEIARARDDLDMERALRPRINTPDVVRSTLSHKELKYNESTIDQLLGAPNKIVIPERYIPEQMPELSAAEQEQRLKKAESIRKMLSETTVTAPEGSEENVNTGRPDTLKRKVAAEKRQREHILQLNQILAKQVMEKSKMVAVKALATLPLTSEASFDDEDLSPITPLPLYQQRENFYS